MIQINKTFISLFGGIGGFDLPLKKKDWKCVGYYEIDKYCIKTYNKNFKTDFKPTDIRKVPAEEVPDHTLLIAGFPCQSFSIAGKRKGFEDTRGTLFFEICRIIKAKRPPYLLLENVKGLLSHQEGETFRVILQSLDELGYDAEWQVLNSKHFGVPQNRERVFIIGYFRGKPRPKVFPIKEDAGEVSGLSEREIKMIQLCGDRDNPKLSESKQAFTVNANPMSDRQQMVLETARALDANMHKGVTPESFFEKKKRNIIQSHSPRCGNPKKGGTGLLESEEHCFTLDSSPHFINKLRRLTPKECERLQGFPDNWTEGVSDTQRYKQLGNAVTVNVVDAITEKLLEVM